MPLRYKYPLSDWVVDPHILELGDNLAFYGDKIGRPYEVVGSFLYELNDGKHLCILLDDNTKEIISCIDTIIYKISKQNKKECTCGAKYTSIPNYHYNWCDILKKD